MTRNRKAERRQYPRIEQRLPIKVAANGYDFVTSTENVSCIGAYCFINKYVPPFTKVMIRLTLPVKSNVSSKNYSVECKGVVIRTDDESTDGFNIAIFFNEIKDGQRKKISQYINQFLPEKSCVTKRI
jgi:c-di-GMP-binding flagellar brake protein YcgR